MQSANRDTQSSRINFVENARANTVMQMVASPKITRKVPKKNGTRFSVIRAR